MSIDSTEKPGQIKTQEQCMQRLPNLKVSYAFKLAEAVRGWHRLKELACDSWNNHTKAMDTPGTGDWVMQM